MGVRNVNILGQCSQEVEINREIIQEIDQGFPELSKKKKDLLLN